MYPSLKYKIFLLIVLLLGTLFFSCKKDKTADPTIEKYKGLLIDERRSYNSDYSDTTISTIIIKHFVKGGINISDSIEMDYPDDYPVMLYFHSGDAHSAVYVANFAPPNNGPSGLTQFYTPDSLSAVYTNSAGVQSTENKYFFGKRQ